MMDISCKSQNAVGFPSYQIVPDDVVEHYASDGNCVYKDNRWYAQCCVSWRCASGSTSSIFRCLPTDPQPPDSLKHWYFG